MSDLQCFHGMPAAQCQHERCADANNRIDSLEDELRDKIAMAALTGLLAYPGQEGRGSHHSNSTSTLTARDAYAYADEMMKARRKRVASGIGLPGLRENCPHEGIPCRFCGSDS